MKLLATLAAGSLAVIAVAAPATAQHTRTVVTKVHGPLKILPHHNRKVCRVTTVHHRKVKKCHYN